MIVLALSEGRNTRRTLRHRIPTRNVYETCRHTIQKLFESIPEDLRITKRQYVNPRTKERIIRDIPIKMTINKNTINAIRTMMYINASTIVKSVVRNAIKYRIIHPGKAKYHPITKLPEEKENPKRFPIQEKSFLPQVNITKDILYGVKAELASGALQIMSSDEQLYNIIYNKQQQDKREEVIKPSVKSPNKKRKAPATKEKSSKLSKKSKST